MALNNLNRDGSIGNLIIFIKFPKTNNQTRF